MRHIFKSIIITVIALYLANSLIPAVHTGVDPKNIAIIIGSFLVANVVIRPIFSIVLLPINILTLGSLAFVVNLALVWLLTRFLPGFSISSYYFPGANIQGFIVPSTFLNQIEAIVAIAAIITITQKILHIIFE